MAWSRSADRRVWPPLCTLGLLLLSACASAPSQPPTPEPVAAQAEPAPRPPARARNLRINLDGQRFRYYEDGRLVREGPVSAGSAEHPTPSGRFRVLSKEENKVSRSYTNYFGRPTPMPYAMQFYGAYFIHEGWLPGYPDSHGCVRLHYEDARFLFERMRRGDPVVITEAGGARPYRPTPDSGLGGSWLSIDDPRRRW